MKRGVEYMKMGKRIAAVFLAVCLLSVLAAPAIPTVKAASGKVYYPIDFTSGVAKCRIKQLPETGDCAVVSMATIESYLYGAKTAAEKETVYNAVIKKNGAVAWAYWSKVGYASFEYIDYEELYTQLERGTPAIIYRSGYGQQHWSVVTGYVGPADHLDPAGFRIVDVGDEYTEKTCVKTYNEWKGDFTVSRMAIRENGSAIPMSGVRLAVNKPKTVHIYGEGSPVYGWITSVSGLQTAQVKVVSLSEKKVLVNESLPLGAVKEDATLKDINAKMTYAKWPVGEYYYILYAKDQAGNVNTYVKYFTIQKSWPEKAPRLLLDIRYDGGNAPAVLNRVDQVQLNTQFVLPNSSEFEFTGGVGAGNYTFIGWNVERSDGTWHCAKNGWLTPAQIESKGDTKSLFAEDTMATLNYYWINGALTKESYTFHAVWEKTGGNSNNQTGDSGFIGDALDELLGKLPGILPGLNQDKQDPEDGADGSAETTGPQETLPGSGDAISGWHEKDGSEYYYRNGEAVTGLQYIENRLHYFDEDGVKQYGWINIGAERYNEWYYFAEEGEAPDLLTLPERIKAEIDPLEHTTVINLVHSGVTETMLEIPVEQSGWGVVAYKLQYDFSATEKIPQTIRTETGIRIKLAEPVRLVVADESMDFPDIPAGFWAENEIDYVTARGIMNGKRSGNFEPTEAITRKTVAMILWRIMGSPVVDVDTQLTDVNRNDIYTQAICWAEDSGIITGYNDGTFQGDGKLSRQHFALMLYRFANYTECNLEPDNAKMLSEFGDNASVSGVSRDAVQWAVNHSLINGRSNGNFDPQGNTTRGQLAVIMARFLQKYYAQQ